MKQALIVGSLLFVWAALWALFHRPRSKSRILMVVAAGVALLAFLMFFTRFQGEANAHTYAGAHCDLTVTASNGAYLEGRGRYECPSQHRHLRLYVSLFRCTGEEWRACGPGNRAWFTPDVRRDCDSCAVETARKWENWTTRGCKFGAWAEGTAWHSDGNIGHGPRTRVDYTWNLNKARCRELKG